MLYWSDCIYKCRRDLFEARMPLCVQHRGGSSLNAKGQQTVLPDLYGNAGTKMTLIPASILTLEVSRKLLMRFQKGNPGSVHEAERVDARFRHIGHVADAVGVHSAIDFTAWSSFR